MRPMGTMDFPRGLATPLWLLLSCLLWGAWACAPATFGPTTGSGDGPGGISNENPVCPADPDCAIGGDCSLYECPDHWECETQPSGGEVCVSPGPDYPDEGGGGRWTCTDEHGVTRCTREGGSLPDDGGGGGWTCERQGDLVVCEKDDPDYPDDGGGGTWDCWFEGEFRVCSRPGDDGGSGGGGGGAGGGDDGGGSGGGAGGGGGDDGREHCVGDSCDPPACPTDARGTVTFVDDRDGRDDGEIYALGDGTRDRSCATVYVDVTGYYQVFDRYIAESCTRQLDETGYLTISNSCNADGEPLEENVGDHFLVDDVDNTMSCTTDADCGGGLVCRDGTRVRCCVDPTPIFMGTFLLRAGEANELCINHWCPEYRDGRSADGHANAGCDSSIDSIHVVLDGSTFLCPDEAELPLSLSALTASR